MEALYRELRNKLITMELTPGRLLSENAIASETGQSRAQVRDILTRLSEEGFLVTCPQRGSEVTRISRNRVREAAHAHVVLEQAILEELLHSGDFEAALAALRDYMLELKQYKDGEMLILQTESERRIYEILSGYCGRRSVFAYLDKIDSDLLRATAMRFNTFNYNQYASSLTAWENTLLEIRMLADQLGKRQLDAAMMLSSGHYSNLMFAVDTMSGIFPDFFCE